ncbi:MAG: DUF4843 domain-containing protein [Odoribacter sp.]|nr:DUF4843 domain-containing protein [Odoribacter sp.]
MKRYIFPILFSGLALACAEDDLVRYDQDKDGLNFYSGNGSVLVEDDASALQRELNFANITYVAKKPGDRQEETYYYGDSLASFTYENIYMQIQGFPSPDERPYHLKVVKLEEEESDFLPEVVFEPFYSVSPNSVLDTIRFTIMRPKQDGRFMRGVYRFGITVDTEDNPFFLEGATERNVLKVTVRDVYEKPAFWDDRKEWLGEFDQEKYAFMLSYSQLPFTRNNEKMRERTEEYNQELIAYLNEHPEIAERFETPLPDMPKMVWWDANKHLLGEYSKEKLEFMQGVLDGEPLQNNDKLLYWNIRFREEAEQTAFEFPRNEQEALWWDNQALGAFTPEKQEYVIKCIFETCQLNNIPGDAWDYVPSVLRLEVDAYNMTHPDAPLGFSFPEGNEQPDWWGKREELFGEFSPIKRDVIVKALFEYNRDTPWEPVKGIPQLKNEQLSNEAFSASYMGNIKNAIEAYNDEHPGQSIELPVVLPNWWSVPFLGEYNDQKEKFVENVMSQYSAGPNQYTQWNQWNAIFRYEAKIKNDPDVVFPALDESVVKPSYWDTYTYLGEYSESKLVFTWMMLLKPCYGEVKEGVLGNDWPFYSQKNVYNYLITSYRENYNTFMTRYAASAEAFSYPATFPEN